MFEFCGLLSSVPVRKHFKSELSNSRFNWLLFLKYAA